MIRLLVVDDSKAVHNYLKDCFNGTEHQIEHAYNGEEAIKKLAGATFDLILLDWEMPVMTGPELLAKMKDQKITIPVIMMTSKNNSSDIVQMLGLGAKEYIMKPFTQDIVFEKIESVLGIKVAKNAA